jgi:hypothetical protein
MRSLRNRAHNCQHTGNLFSGSTVRETARIQGERITALLQSRLGCLLEGFELHHVTLDDQLVQNIINELTGLRSKWIENAGQTLMHDSVLGRRLVGASTYVQMLEQNVGLHSNEIRTQIDRRRLMPKKVEPNASINIYHVSGHNNRWVTNSQDYSVDVVTQSVDLRPCAEAIAATFDSPSRKTQASAGAIARPSLCNEADTDGLRRDQARDINHAAARRSACP